MVPAGEPSCRPAAPLDPLAEPSEVVGRFCSICRRLFLINVPPRHSFVFILQNFRKNTTVLQMDLQPKPPTDQRGRSLSRTPAGAKLPWGADSRGPKGGQSRFRPAEPVLVHHGLEPAAPPPPKKKKTEKEKGRIRLFIKEEPFSSSVLKIRFCEILRSLKCSQSLSLNQTWGCTWLFLELLGPAPSLPSAPLPSCWRGLLVFRGSGLKRTRTSDLMDLENNLIVLSVKLTLFSLLSLRTPPPALKGNWVQTPLLWCVHASANIHL